MPDDLPTPQVWVTLPDGQAGRGNTARHLWNGRSMSFPIRLILIIILLCGLYGVLLAFTGHLLMGFPLIVLNLLALSLAKPISRQDPGLTALARQLRLAAEDVPADVHRVFRSLGGEHDVIVSRSRTVRRPHRFTVLTRETQDEVAALRPGGESFVTTNVFHVSSAPLPAVVVQIVEATRLAWGQDDSEPHEEPIVDADARRSLRRRLWMARKTNAYTPGRDDLERVLATIRTPEATDDQPR